ncbi:MAG: hypothetical protein AB9888_12715 [Bacteroidales bacterium]
MSSEKNRLQNCLTVSNIQLGNVVSYTFGKSSMRILEKIFENPFDTSFDIEPLIHGSLKNKFHELELAAAGYITPEWLKIKDNQKALSGFGIPESRVRKTDS